MDKRSLAMTYRPHAALARYETKPAVNALPLLQVRALFVAAWRVVLEWRRRARSRAQLRMLSPHLIRDFCLDPMEAEREARKPFWRA